MDGQSGPQRCLLNSAHLCSPHEIPEIPVGGKDLQISHPPFRPSVSSKDIHKDHATHCQPPSGPRDQATLIHRRYAGDSRIEGKAQGTPPDRNIHSSQTTNRVPGNGNQHGGNENLPTREESSEGQKGVPTSLSKRINGQRPCTPHQAPKLNSPSNTSGALYTCGPYRELKFWPSRGVPTKREWN